MNHHLVLGRLCIAVACLAPVATTETTWAQGRCCQICPICKTCCQFKAENTTEEKSCWRVECEKICIPRVVFPWQAKKCSCQACDCSCATSHNGAWVKTVKKLKKHTYKCPTCKYQWSIAKREPDERNAKNKNSSAEKSPPGAAKTNEKEKEKDAPSSNSTESTKKKKPAEEKPSGEDGSGGGKDKPNKEPPAKKSAWRLPFLIHSS